MQRDGLKTRDDEQDAAPKKKKMDNLTQRLLVSSGLHYQHVGIFPNIEVSMPFGLSSTETRASVQLLPGRRFSGKKTKTLFYCLCV